MKILFPIGALLCFTPALTHRTDGLFMLGVGLMIAASVMYARKHLTDGEDG